ncbi:MAG: hypothetical protein ABGW78_12120 [Pirellulales bacterium]
MKTIIIISLSSFFILLFPATDAAEPAASQTKSVRGIVTMKGSIRSVTGTQEQYHKKKEYGPFSFYSVPFYDGTFQCDWKHESTQKVILVFDVDTKPIKHLLEVYINGRPSKGNVDIDKISLVTYDQQKPKVVTETFTTARSGVWHDTRGAFKGDTVTVSIGDQEFQLTHQSLSQHKVRCGIGHCWGTLQTKDVRFQLP